MNFRSLLFAIIACGLSSLSFAQDAPKAVSLFNGKSLEGWDFDPKIWRVEDGLITGGSRTEKIKRNSFIATKQSFQNFDLKLKIKCSGDPKTGLINSGIQVRSARLKNGGAAGYQVDCGQCWFGKIYDEHRRALIYPTPIDEPTLLKAIDTYGWNEYRILAEGPRIQVWINGTKACDFTEKNPQIPLNGIIAPQVHSGGVALVQIKDITIKELPATKGAPTWKSLGGVEAALKKVAQPKKKRNPKPAGKPANSIPAPPKGKERITFDFESGDLQGWYIAEGWFHHLIANNKTIRAGGAPSNKEGQFFMGTLEANADFVPSDTQVGIVESPVFQLNGAKIQLAVSGGDHKDTYVGLYTLDGKEVRKASGNNSEVFQAKTWEVPELVGKPVYVRLVDRNASGWGHVVLDAFSAQGKLLPEETKKRKALAKPNKTSAKPKKRQGKKTQSARTDAWSTAEQLAGFTVPEGFVIELVASEEHGVVNPIDLSFDDSGRLWTQTGKMYPLDPVAGIQWNALLKLMNNPEAQAKNPNFARIKKLYQLKAKGQDKILILDDPTKQATSPLHVWADGLTIPQSILPYKDGAYVCHGSELFLLRDTDGDNKSDKMEPVLTGFGFTDTHTMAHLLVRGPGSYIHFTQGALNKSEVTAVATGNKHRVDASCQVRFQLDHQDFEVLSSGPSNMWGLQLRADGQWYGTEANDYGYSIIPWEHGTGVKGAAYHPLRPYQPLLPELHKFRVGGTGISAMEFSEDTANGFPFNEWKDVALLGNAITSTINAVRIHRNPDGTVEAEHLPDFLTSKDDWFRPVNMEFGPDGCLYVADFYNKIISHNEVTTTHPDRDKSHGRIWRIRHKSQKPRQIPNVVKASPQELLTHLKAPSLWEKRAAWQQIADRGLTKMAPALIKLAADAKEDTTTRIHALWSLEELRHFDDALLNTLLAAKDDDLRREAVRAITSFDLKPADAAALISPFIEGENCMIRSQAIRSLGDLRSPDPAVFAGLISACKPALGGNTLGGSYERNFERFHSRMALERFPAELKKYLESSSAKHPVENLLWAIQALDDAAREKAFLGIWNQVQSRKMDGETFIAITGMLNNPKVFKAVQPIFQNPTNAENLVTQALANQSRVQSKKLTEMLKPLVQQLLTKDKTMALGLRAVEKFQITELGPKVAAIPLPLRDQNLLRQLISAQAISPKLNTANLTKIAKSESLPYDLRAEASYALATVDQKTSYALTKVLLTSGDAQQKAQLAGMFSQSKAGGQIMCAMIQHKVIQPDLFDLSAAERLIQSHPSSPYAKQVISTARQRVAQQRKQAQGKIHNMAAYISKNPGDAEKGKATFGACYACHKVGDTGQDIAPPLDGSGHRDIEHLLTAIIDPDAAVEGGYGLYRITKNDGSSIEGLLDKEEPLGKTIAVMGGAKIFVPQAQIKSASFVGGRSFKPASFGQLPKEMMADLVAYIATLKEGEAAPKKKVAIPSSKQGLILDLDADHGLSLEDGDRVAKWKNQAPGAKGQDFVKRDKGRKKPGSGRPTLRKGVKELNGHNSLQFLQQELVCMDEDAFDHLTQGDGATWLTVISVRDQRVALKDVNSFFGNLKNSKFYGGLWGCLNDDNTLWWGIRNGKSFGRFDENNPKVLGPKLEVGKYYVVAGRIGEGTGEVDLDLFVNNVNSVATAKVPINPKDNPSKMAIGQERDAIQHPGKESFDGEIARFLIFDRALSNAELAKEISTLQNHYGLVDNPKPKTAAIEKEEQPNIILIFTDDQGYEDLGCFGSEKIKTPRIDQMASEGLKLTNFYAQPVCGVSRAALMTGCYPIRVAEPNNKKLLHTVPHPKEITMAEVLKSAGYSTGIIGKWHLTNKVKGGGYNPVTMPNAQGFDYFYGTPVFNGYTVHVDDVPLRVPLYRNEEIVVDKVQTWDPITQDYTKEALNYIETNKDKPFFLYLAHNMPHIPVGSSKNFKGKSEYGPYGDTIEEIDWSTGQILDKLKELGIDDNTLVIFTSDNGPWVETTHAMKSNGKPFIPRDHSGSAAPLRGWKMSTWDGGSKVPFIARWPKKIPAGSESAGILSTMDLYPTFAKLAGAETPKDRTLDGHDATDFLLGISKTSPRDDYFYYSGCLLTGVRVGDWKLVLPRPADPDGTGWWGRLIEEIKETELYNLTTDPGETINVAKKHPDIVSKLMAKIAQGRAELGDLDVVGSGARSFDPQPRTLQDRLKRPKVKTAKPQSKPNFVIILTDDQGYGDLSCYGGKHIDTPRIDQMAKEGARLTSFYVAAPVCTPSRAGLMTGCYPKRINMATGSNFGVLLAGDKKGLNPDEITIAEILKTAGYKTGMFGKWHLGDQPEFMPTRQGFDEFLGIPYSHDIHSFHPRQEKYNFPLLPLLDGEKVIEMEPNADLLTKRFTERAVKFIEKNKDEPFFVYLPHPIPHAPLHVSPAFMKGVDPETVAKLKEEDGNIDYPTRDKLYHQAIAEIDWSVGRILDTLKANGLDENTFVIFTSDNGPPKRTLHASPGILRGNKGTTLEGGLREPTVARWPGKIPAGKDNDKLMTAMDLLPTFAKLAGAKVPTDRVIDGKDIWPVLSQHAETPHEAFFYHTGNNLQAVRSGDWKLHRKGNKLTALYNLKADIAEKNNLIKKHPEIVKRLNGHLKSFEKNIAENNRSAAFVENPVPLSK